MIIDKKPVKQNQQDEEIRPYDIPMHPYSEHTIYLKYVNDFPIEKEKDPLFQDRNANFTRVLNKYPGQSNIDYIDEIRADLLWKDIEFSEMHGMHERAERVSLKLDHLYARSRGREGFGSKIQVTERHEILQQEQKQQQEKKGILGSFRHNKKEKEPVKVYVDQEER